MYTPQTAQAVAQLYQLLLAMMPRRWSSTFEKTMGYRLWDASQDTGELSFVLADGRKLALHAAALLGAPGRVPRTGGEDSCSSPR